MNSLSFNTFKCILIFSEFWKHHFWKEFKALNRESVSSATRKILEYYTESCYKNIFKIRNASFVILQNYKKKF